ncbi:3'-N-debenzoyl-2'-deoxytaxol N-benzoyltransferase-like [Thalictrum thalictroides]|uniref:3'-N-debenzoyl-2'-deoxytaxol N-benzoyltransferase-like n=1 Tax=Thalictrum thalictroides TaxID=46969 RepID=A0A7J6X6E9_THATH|nr:3'-N-debenzoyl-2'-deoxytaxol N-benzoyltransferase-like [Thalictrum thalictroides]
MAFTVTRSSGAIIKPNEPTPSDTLNLSVIDKSPIIRSMDMHTLHVFKHGQEATKVITEALSKALVPYYPLAGRFKESSDGELQVACTGEGLWFIEAFANCSLESFKYFDDILSVPHAELLPTPPPETYGIDPIVKIQLTHFTCEGFVLAYNTRHSICDGLGTAQFLNAVGEFARGFEHPTIAPVWDREAIPTSSKQALPLGEPGLPLALPPMPNFQLEHATIDISREKINKLKNEFQELTGNYCSSFDVVVASLWRYRTQAINLDEDISVNLVFSANTRKFLDPPLADGYYGNCFHPVIVTASSGWLVDASITEIVKLIKAAKARVPTEFVKWLTSEDHVGDPSAIPLLYTTLCISEWAGLGFNRVDYGWGPPVQVLPIQGFHIIPTAIVGLPPMPSKGIRLMTWCVNNKHLPALVDQTMSLS